MVSLIVASYPAHFTVCRQPASQLSLQNRLLSFGLVISAPKRQHLLRSKRRQVKQGRKNQCLLEFSDYRGVVRMCKREGTGDLALELELLEFMKNSKNPEMFPSKRELIECGRADLAEAIEKNGGWMSMGWEDEEGEEVEIEDGSVKNLEFEMGQNEFEVEVEARSGSGLNEHQYSEGTSFSGDSPPAASSSGRSIEMETEDDSGIDGILNRLEKQRSLTFGLNLERNGGINHVSVEICDDKQNARMPKEVENSFPAEIRDPASLGHHDSERMSRPHSNTSSCSGQADSWRTWSLQRAGISNTEFEAGEIDYGKSTNGRTVDSRGEIVVITSDTREPSDKTKDSDSFVKDFSQSNVKTRLQDLELELSSALHSLKSNNSGFSEKAKEPTSENFRQLSDASEFQETEIMSAREKLRSIRAKLAVLEGKMALAITDAQKVVDEKQKRIDKARKALQLLRNTCIVWPNSGSEVLVAGSFDGWATQRKMEKSSAGIFSLWLKLYPGQYEIKFIVDGSWKVDPLRPIVNNGALTATVEPLLLVTPVSTVYSHSYDIQKFAYKEVPRLIEEAKRLSREMKDEPEKFRSILFPRKL